MPRINLKPNFVANPPKLSMCTLIAVHVYLTYPFVLSWSLLEAMSLGCSIVASDTTPLHEAIEHNQTGRLVDFFDVQGIADNVTELLNNSQERQRLGQNAREFAIKNYDLKSVCLPRQLQWVRIFYLILLLVVICAFRWKFKRPITRLFSWKYFRSKKDQ